MEHGGGSFPPCGSIFKILIIKSILQHKHENMEKKQFHKMTVAEKLESSIFFKIGYLISKEVGENGNYSELDRYYYYQHNVRSEKTDGGRVYTSVLWLAPEIAKKHGMPEKIEIKTGTVTVKRDVFYKDGHTGTTVFTEPYETEEGEGENRDAHTKLLAGFFTAQSEKTILKP